MKPSAILLFIVFVCFNPNASACSILSLRAGDETLIGRNFDYAREDGRVCFFKKAAAKHAHFTIHQYGESMPYEGVNEYGLFVGINEVQSVRASAPFSLGRKSTTSLGILKKILEGSRNVPEAIAKFDEYNVVFGRLFGFPVLHYLISDRSGDSAIVEFMDDSMNVINKGEQRYQLMTNFLVSEFPHSEALKEKLFYRYRLAAANLDREDRLGMKDVGKVIQLISQEADVMPGIKLIFNEDRKYSFDEIKSIFLIDKAMPPEIMEPFDKTALYFPEEIGHRMSAALLKHRVTPSHTIWSAIYDIGKDDINVELYYKRDWKNPWKINLTERMSGMDKTVDCVEIESVFK